MISPVLDKTDTRVSLKGTLWEIRDLQASFVQQLCQSTEISPFLSGLVCSRIQNIQDVQAFLAPKLNEHLPSPFVLPDIDKAIARIIAALKAGEKIALWGDYDVDGGTSVALWQRFLKPLMGNVRSYIPDRFREGYGVNKQGLDTLKQEGAHLVITLDCGTNATEALTHAQNIGLDVIVVDHHDAEDHLPPACAVINPKRKDARPECGDLSILAAVGVSFLCLVALRAHLQKDPQFSDQANIDLRLFLDLVALGTVCDVVPLTGINRLLTMKGLEAINRCPTPGIAALLEAANVQDQVTAYHLGFVLGPRLNAGGRMAESHLACALLSIDDVGRARPRAERLSHLNRERQAIDRAVTEEAYQKADVQKASPFLVVHGDQWHEGVIGIVASRLKDKYQKPTFVLTFDDHGKGKGSGRSLPGIPLGKLIHEAAQKGLILQGGGHDMAGGLSLRLDQVEAFRAFCNKSLLSRPSAPQKVRTIDACLSFQSLTFDLFHEVSQLEPFGAHNPKPLFLFEHVRLAYKRPLKGDHFYLDFVQPDGTAASALLFNSTNSRFTPYLDTRRAQPFDLIASITFDTWRQKVILGIEDMILSP